MLVHCVYGRSRSAALIVAYLLYSDHTQVRRAQSTERRASSTHPPPTIPLLPAREQKTLGDAC